MYQLLRGIVLIAAMMLNCEVGFAQTPPTATEAFNLRIRCKEMAEQKLDDLSFHPMSIADGASMGMSAANVAALNKQITPEVLGSWQSSKYDAKNNRCYVQIYIHTRKASFDIEHRQVYDAQKDDLLADAMIKNGEKSGQVYDEYKGPWVPPKDCRMCMSGWGWDAAIAYMDEIMTDKRN